MTAISVVASAQPNSAASNPTPSAQPSKINGLDVTKLNFDRPKDWKVFIEDRIKTLKHKTDNTSLSTTILEIALYLEIIVNAALAIFVGQGALVMSLIMVGTFVISAGRSRGKREAMLKIEQLKMLVYTLHTKHFRDCLKASQTKFGRAFTTDHLNYLSQAVHNK